jgi:hypothetical protein
LGFVAAAAGRRLGRADRAGACGRGSGSAWPPGPGSSGW